jgi:hypothetical protein
MPTVEEINEFDDDFDLPLPDRPIPSSGAASQSRYPTGVPGNTIPSSQIPANVKIVSDSSPYKMYVASSFYLLDARPLKNVT